MPSCLGSLGNNEVDAGVGDANGVRDRRDHRRDDDPRIVRGSRERRRITECDTQDGHILLEYDLEFRREFGSWE